MKALPYLLALVFTLPLTGQVRYLDPVFSAVETTYEVEYGQNTTVVLEQTLGPLKIPLLMDVYQPAGDTATDRPLAILIHSGNFLPVSVNGTNQGTRQDSALVYLATQLARRGYVAAVPDHRLGWNPVSPDAFVRRFTLINALYRGIQDVNTCARFFSRHADSFGIDPKKIMVWGDGSGGLLASSAAALDSFEEWLLPQFTNPGNPTLPLMVDEAINGDIYATTVGVVPAGYPFYTEGDTLCHPNHVGFEAQVKLAVSMNGGIVDTSWMDGGEAACIAFHALPDPCLPYDTCGAGCWDYLPPPLNQPLLEVCGERLAVAHALSLGNNESFAGVSFPDDFSSVANARNDGLDGLFPLFSIPIAPLEVAYPWQWWDESLGANFTTPEAARLHLDTMLAYVAPRACASLNLSCPGVTDLSELPAPKPPLPTFPHPRDDLLTVQLEAQSPGTGTLEILSLDGRLLRRQFTQGNQARCRVNDLPPGIYLLRWKVQDSTFQGKFVRP